MPYKDLEKQKAAQRKSHEKLRSERRRADRERKNFWLEVIRSKKEVPCADCKNQYPYYVMQFDHVRGIKIANVSRLVTDRRYKMAIEEIEKCDIVCANCHAERTFQRQPSGPDDPRYIA